MFASKLFRKAAIAGLAAALFCAPAQSFAKETVKVGFIGPLTGGLSSLGVGGRNSAELAVQEANEDPNTKFLYEMTAYDDECKPNVGPGSHEGRLRQKDGGRRYALLFRRGSWHCGHLPPL